MQMEQTLKTTELKVARPAASSETAALVVPHFTIRARRGWIHINFAELWRFRDLLLALASRDLKLRYKQTALGIVWVVLQPLVAALVFAFVFGKVAKMPSGGIPYVVFAFTGLLAWNLFNNVITKASACLVGNAHLVSKVFFPRLILPLSTVLSALVDFAASAVMMGVLMAMYGIAPGWAIMMVPVWMALLLALSLGIGLVAAALTVNYRDVQYIIPVAIQILLYGSPVAYAVSAVPANLRHFYDLNPLSAVIEGFRWSILGSGEFSLAGLAYASGVAVASLLVGAFAFKRMERSFADVI
jgi:lipopolysaccharide transport system permease protein